MDIEVSFPGGARVDARIGAHTVHTDQPREEPRNQKAQEPPKEKQQERGRSNRR